MSTVAVGCGAKADSGSSAPTTQTGGKSSISSVGSVGGTKTSGGTSTALASGGSVASGSATTATGGVFTTQTQSTVGGLTGIGGTLSVTTVTTQSRGGGTEAGGTRAAGGESAAGAVMSKGGTTSAAGAAAIGGADLGGGGMTAVGGTSGVGGTRATSIGFAGAGAGLNEFCTGDDSKVSYGAKVIPAPASSYQSSLVMDCCQGYGINLHTKPALDFDIAIETVWTGASSSTFSFVVGTSYQPMRALVRRSTDSLSSSGVGATGAGVLLTPFSFDEPFDLGLCLQVGPTETPLNGTLIYIPKVTISSFSSRSRFQIFLLSDATIATAQVLAQPLDALTLAQNPILDLYKITYLSTSTHELGLNPGQKIGDSVKTQLGSAMTVPFVVVADGERVFLGTFVSSSSSMTYSIPLIPTDGIQSDTMKFNVPAGDKSLADTRITSVLGSLGRMIP